ncbi:putative TIR domain, P-loop containing nucleoside triphosphate hydrolase [Helianthus annuus]|nr:putative TIR domain, P-loop containing nucleoside triphosphate hydrolase [Helianthus annuus]
MASSSQSYNCDVFLSFRGDDTRKTFVDHLYSALVDRNISTYKDDETLPQGEPIGPSLIKAIEGSRIAVIIFSENYANSSWCLDELVHIMKCKDEGELVVLPLFYGVDPSEVKKQKRKYEEAFNKHEVENNSKVELWRKALVDAGEISGWELKNIANGHESKAIKEIADTISDKLLSITPDVNEDLVGIRARLQELEAHLDIGSGGVRMVGIWGVGGSGKTTLAFSLYMKISSRFQSHCVVDNIREEARKHGLNTLQEKILARISKTQVGVQSVDVGKHMIRSRSSRSNVLILLDDVDDIKQLEALAGSHKWFGSGSRIIITTRDEHVLVTHKVDQVCPVTLLSHEEALQLFNKHAYNKNNHVNNYDTLSSHMVSYAAGLPLALKVLGSFLYDKDEKEWVSSLARLKDIPDMEIMEKLKISYDGLKPVEKELFLDIACFFRQTLFLGHAMEIFEACGYHPDIGIKVLRQKALITMDDDFLDMHDLVQELGYYIVKGDHPNDPETHSRFLEDTMYLAGATVENHKIEAMQLYPCWYGDGASSHVYKIVSNMKKLRWLRVFQNFEDHAEGPSFLSNELRYISWKHYPRSPFPDCFQPMKLVHLKLTHSLQNELWMGYKHLPHLKVLQLDNMKNLHRTPDFDGLPCLQKLELTNCDKLTEIHRSLGNHASLEQISVSKCDELRIIPTIVQMRKLKTLEIERCHKSLEFPEIKSYMESLVKLSLQGMGIDSLLSSIGERCGNLISLRLILCYHLKIVEVNFDGLIYLKIFALHKLEYMQMPICNSTPLRHWYGNQLSSWLQPSWTLSLQKLDLSNCNLTDGVIPNDICELSNLRELNLSHNYFTRFQFSLSQLTQLKVLNLSWCESLVEFPELPSRLAILRADACWELEAIGDLKNKCTRLCQVSLMFGSSMKDGSRLLECMLQVCTTSSLFSSVNFLSFLDTEILRSDETVLTS